MRDKQHILHCCPYPNKALGYGYACWPQYFSLSFEERGKTLIQKKPTMYPAWRSTFDAHIYEGRVIQVLLMRTAEEPLAEVTVGVSVLAERCKKANGHAEFWVRYIGVVYLCMCW